MIATWWMGLFLSLPLTLIARAGSPPKLAARDLVRPLAVLMGCVGLLALSAGIVGYHQDPAGSFGLPEGVPPEKRAAFVGDLWAHSASYLFGALGAVVVWVWAWGKRRRLSAGAGRESASGRPEP